MKIIKNSSTKKQNQLELTLMFARYGDPDFFPYDFFS
jgi:hypothetical protein